MSSCYWLVRLASAGLLVARAEERARFVTATASSVYGGGGSAFAATQATTPGSSYWCSAGDHSTAQTVSWTGLLPSDRRAVGIAIDWAYSPEEFQVLLSADGANFAEAACWKRTTQEAAHFVEHVMFESSQRARAATVVMRGPRAWKYFGINSVEVLSEHGPIMLVSGRTQAMGDECVVRNGTSVALKPCMNALATGSGVDVFRLSASGVLESLSGNGGCVSVADPTRAHSGLAIYPCNAIIHDGRAHFALPASGQLRVSVGNACVVADGNNFAVRDCDQAANSVGAADKFSIIAVPEAVPSAAAAVFAAADLAKKTAARLAGFTSSLREAAAALAACGAGASASSKPGESQAPVLAQQHSSFDEPGGGLISVLLSELDVGTLPKLMSDARGAIAAVRARL